VMMTMKFSDRIVVHINKAGCGGLSIEAKEAESEDERCQVHYTNSESKHRTSGYDPLR
jgi:hypothetical protein